MALVKALVWFLDCLRCRCHRYAFVLVFLCVSWILTETKTKSLPKWLSRNYELYFKKYKVLTCEFEIFIVRPWRTPWTKCQDAGQESLTHIDLNTHHFSHPAIPLLEDQTSRIETCAFAQSETASLTNGVLHIRKEAPTVYIVADFHTDLLYCISNCIVDGQDGVFGA